jgi:hypothetical protein
MWVAVGAIGLLLTGIGMVASLVVYEELFELAEKADQPKDIDQDNFGDTASELYDTGKLTELESRITERQTTRPNDGELFWWKARLHVAKKEYSEALRQLDLVQLHSPSWAKDYVEPLREAIRRSLEGQK